MHARKHAPKSAEGEGRPIVTAIYHLTTALVVASYGADEADVLEGDHIRVTVRRPLAPGGVA